MLFFDGRYPRRAWPVLAEYIRPNVYPKKVGSTALSARLDPEDMREIIGAYHRCSAEQITRAGGRRKVHGRRSACLLRLPFGKRR